ncbi:MAG: putative ABC transporter permease [Clostridiales bacterium]|nr:putative ABC transporter permease [Clostridiales bacterium]
MSFVLLLAFLFFVGSLTGWVLELFYRRFISQKKWVNPGFLSGPYLPIYGFGLVLLYLIASVEPYIDFDHPLLEKLVLFTLMMLGMTIVEYIAGIMCLKYFKLRLWDYTDRWGNIQGVICPLYSFLWSVLGAIYYFLIHPHILRSLEWLSRNLAFSFFIGFFYGVFLMDLFHSTRVVLAIKKFASQQQLILHYEEIKERIGRYKESRLIRAGFIFRMWMDNPFSRFLKDSYETTRDAISDLTDGLKESLQSAGFSSKSTSSDSSSSPKSENDKNIVKR